MDTAVLYISYGVVPVSVSQCRQYWRAFEAAGESVPCVRVMDFRTGGHETASAYYSQHNESLSPYVRGGFLHHTVWRETEPAAMDRCDTRDRGIVFPWPVKP